MENKFFDKINNATLSRLNITTNAGVILNLFKESDGHIYVSGCTGTGKSIIAQGLAEALDAEYQDFTELSVNDEWASRCNEVLSNILDGSPKTVIIDGFDHMPDNQEYEMLMRSVRLKGIRLIAFAIPTARKGSYVFSRQAVLSYSVVDGQSTVLCSDVTLNLDQRDTTGIAVSDVPVAPGPVRTRSKCPLPVKKYAYTNFAGEQKFWSGQGRKPAAIAAALEAGKRLEDFLFTPAKHD